MIIYMGIAGSGKGTQCEMIAKRLHYTHVAMSDLIRAYASDAQQAKMHAGALLDDNDAISIAAKGLSAQLVLDKVLLDGFPRTLVQATWLVQEAKDGKYHVEAVINLEVAPDRARERLRLRARDDDTPELIKARFGWYETNVAPTVEYFKTKNLPVYDIEASGTPEEVYDLTIRALHAADVVS